MSKEIGIIPAAGKGERLRPLTLWTPKPLVKVHGIPMIETSIVGMIKRGVSDIFVIVGYLKESFSYLPEKYPMVHLVENKEYTYKNNISSIHAVIDELGKGDCIFSDGDLFVRDSSVFQLDMKASFACGKLIQGVTDEWVYHMRGQRVIGLGPGGNNEYAMGGITYLKKNDA